MAGRHPCVPALHAQARPFIIHPQIAVAAADDGLGHHRLDFMRHHADIGFAAAIVAEPVKAETVIETGEHDDVVLQAELTGICVPRMTTPTAVETKEMYATARP